MQALRGAITCTEDSKAEIDAKTFLLGHAWGRYQLARHNGYNGNADLARSYRDTWPKPLVAPFGGACGFTVHPL